MLVLSCTLNSRSMSVLNAELGRLCPFSAPRGIHFQLVSLGSPPGRIVWPQVCQIYPSQTEKFSRYTLILYFSPIQYWRNYRKICQTVSEKPKIMEKFSQPADENGHVLLPGFPPRVFHGQIFTPDKDRVSAPNAPSKSDPNYSPLKKLKRLEKNSLSTLVIFIYHNC